MQLDNSVKSGLKASVVERFNRTFKNKMYKYFTTKDTLTCINVLPKLVKSYNNTYHRSIKMKPTQVTEVNEAKVWDTLYGGDVQKRVRFKFQAKWEIALGSERLRGCLKSLTFPITRKKYLRSTNDLRAKYRSITWKILFIYLFIYLFIFYL